ncbi:MAG: hypothetical protein GY814_17560 [Gammaproteobacteria bacterium]|nr:hypothetical protein [Gammaproteobacteria bacterium]
MKAVCAWQQDKQALHRLREHGFQNRTTLCNHLHGLMAKYGLKLRLRVNVLHQFLPELLESGENGLSDFFCGILAKGYQQLLELNVHIHKA